MRSLLFNSWFQIGILTLLLARFTIIVGWHATEYHVEKPTHPGKCFSHQFNIYVKVGKTVRDVETSRHKYCQKMSCVRDNNGDLKLLHAGCPYLAPKPHCKVIQGDIDLAYPFCCSRLQCRENLRKDHYGRDGEYVYRDGEYVYLI